MILFAVIFSYFLGSIPFGLLISRLKGVDIRSVGSGNIGATNIARALGKKYAIITFILDGLKGFIPTYLAVHSQSMHNYAGLIAIAAVMGHIFSIFLKFKGGKGVATTIMTYLALNTLIGISVMLTWLSIFIVTKYSSLSAIMALFIGLFLACATKDAGITAFGLVTFAIIIYKHIPNIRRLIAGKEGRF